MKIIIGILLLIYALCVLVINIRRINDRKRSNRKHTKI